MLSSRDATADGISVNDCTILAATEGGKVDDSVNECVPVSTTPDVPDTPTSMLIASMRAWSDDMDLLEADDDEWEDIADVAEDSVARIISSIRTMQTDTGTSEKSDGTSITNVEKCSGTDGPRTTTKETPISDDRHASAREFFTNVAERNSRHDNGTGCDVTRDVTRSASGGDGDYENILNFFDTIRDPHEAYLRGDTPISLMETPHTGQPESGNTAVDIAAVTRYIGNAKHILRNYLVHEQTVSLYS